MNEYIIEFEKKFNYLTEKAYNKAIKDDDISQLDDNEKVFFVLADLHPLRAVNRK
mgnify:CR=1 FL=1